MLKKEAKRLEHIKYHMESTFTYVEEQLNAFQAILTPAPIYVAAFELVFAFVTMPPSAMPPISAPFFVTAMFAATFPLKSLAFSHRLSIPLDNEKNSAGFSKQSI